MVTRRQSTGGQVTDGSAGIAADASGNPALDPSRNVSALSEAGHKRQDDLRVATKELFQAQLKCLEENITLHVKHMKEMNAAESRRVDEQAQLRADFSDKLSNAEAKRIDAIRAVDVNAVSVASQRASDQATVLANQVAQSAEALRGLVASTANTNAQSQGTANSTLSTRITTLEQAQYKGEGKGLGIGASWGVFLAIATLVAGGAIAYVAVNRAPPAAPQIVYVPAPAPSSPGAPPIVTAPATVVSPSAPRQP